MQPNPEPQTSKLIRGLGPTAATAVVVGTVIGSGIFKKPQVVADNLPTFSLAALVWVLGGTLALFGALTLAETAALFPKSGGNFLYLRAGFGRFWGFLWAWVEFCVVKAASIAALATIFTESLRDVVRHTTASQDNWLEDFWARSWLTVGVILVLALVNVRGVRWGGGLQLLVTSVKIGSLLALVALPFAAAWLARPGVETPSPQPGNLLPIAPAEADWTILGRIGTGLLAVLWAYHGWMNVAPVAEEVRSPQRNVPLALIAGTGIVMALYLSVNVAYYLILPSSEIARIKDTTVAAEFTHRLLGPAGAAAASAAVMISVFGALNGNLLVGPRVLYALSEDGLTPRTFSEVHPRFRTPAKAILLLAIWSCLLVLGASALSKYPISFLPVDPKKGLFDTMTDFAMFGAVIFETLAVAAIFPIRRRYPDWERPYRCWGYPVVPVIYIVILVGVVTNMFFYQQTEARAGLGFIAVGAVVYVFLRKNRTAVTA